MILIVCEPCTLCLRVMGDPDEVDHLVGEKSEFWRRGQYTCPRCEKKCEALREHEADPKVYAFLRLVDLNPEEAFAALNGLGLPEEGDCRKQVVEELLKNHRVTRVKGKDIFGTNRSRIDYLELEDGTKLYLASGAEGAVVYRVVRPTSYVEKVDGR